MKIKQNIPNAITCGNLLCGCLAIVQAFEGNLVWAAYLVGIAAVLDFFDGFAARLLNVSSPIGKDLDSLADMVTFGVVPGVVMFKIIQYGILLESGFKDETGFLVTHDGNNWNYIHYFGFIITIFSGVRLAIFNNDTRQSESFIGLPTPANAIFILSLPLIVKWDPTFVSEKHLEYKVLLNPYLLLTTSFLLSFLLISPISLFALKFKHFKWQGNEIRYVFLGLALILLVTLQFVGIPLAIILYILMSIIGNLVKKRNRASV